MKNRILFILIFGMLVLPMVSADIIMPTLTKVYFEQSGQQYNGKIDFTIKGYGYSYPVGPLIEKKQGTYTPEVVFSFSATDNNYGDKIYENYYRNYRHIDYYEVEGKTADGKRFIIKNISSIPTNCYPTDIEIDGKYYSDPTNCLNKPHSEFPSDVSPGEYCKNILVETPKETNDGGDVIEQLCELRFNLNNADWNFNPSTPEPNGFWNKIICFFKGLVGKKC